MVAKRKFATSVSSAVIHKALSSKIVLFGGLVALVILTCPGARGAGLSDVEVAPLPIVGESFGLAADVDPAWLHATNAGPAAAGQAAVTPDRSPSSMASGRSTRHMTTAKVVAASSTESASEELFQLSSRAIPMMVGPMLNSSATSASFRPMVGAAVGVNTWKERFAR